jgi:hypothetical protein
MLTCVQAAYTAREKELGGPAQASASGGAALKEGAKRGVDIPDLPADAGAIPFPTFPVQQRCEQQVREYQGSQAYDRQLAQCIQSEQASYDLGKDLWERLSDAQRQYVLARIVPFNWPEPYATMLQLLEALAPPPAGSTTFHP